MKLKQQQALLICVFVWLPDTLVLVFFTLGVMLWHRSATLHYNAFIHTVPC